MPDVKQIVDEFILEHVDSVPHLEAMLLLWNSRPKRWKVEEMANALYLDFNSTKAILDNICARGFCVEEAESSSWSFTNDPGRDELLASVHRTYQTELIRISRMIHNKQSTPIQEFAKAFRFKKSGGNK